MDRTKTPYLRDRDGALTNDEVSVSTNESADRSSRMRIYKRIAVACLMLARKVKLCKLSASVTVH